MVIPPVIKILNQQEKTTTEKTLSYIIISHFLRIKIFTGASLNYSFITTISE